MANALRNEAGTPRELFLTLHGEYRFTLDVCASHHNAKLDRYLTVRGNALAMSWEGERVWCNPPYNNIPSWLMHALEGDFAAFFLPSRTDRHWWRLFKPIAECHYFVGEKPYRRPQFDPPLGVEYSSNPYSMVLFLFGREATPGLEAYRCGTTGRRIG